MRRRMVESGETKIIVEVAPLGVFLVRDDWMKGRIVPAYENGKAILRRCLDWLPVTLCKLALQLSATCAQAF